MVQAPFRRLMHVLDKRAISKVESLQDRFTLIYRRNSWGSKESFSGVGSTLTFTSGYANPELEADSGHILYVENRRPISRASDQTEDIKIVVEF